MTATSYRGPMLIRDARLVAVTDPVPAPVDVRVEAGRVVEVGAGLTAAGSETSYDAGGGWLMPGLWDQHVHLGQWTLASARLDLGPARSSAEAVAMVRERLEQWPDLPVIGWGHRPTAWPDNPVVSDLDAIDTDQPIVLIAGDGHHGWLNSIALMTLALPSREGVVAEGEWFAAYARLATVLSDDGTGPEAILRTQQEAVALGVVGVTDLEFSGGPDAWIDRWEVGAGLLRIRAATYADGLDAVIERGLRTGDVLPGCDDREAEADPEDRKRPPGVALGHEDERQRGVEAPGGDLSESGNLEFVATGHDELVPADEQKVT